MIPIEYLESNSVTKSKFKVSRWHGLVMIAMFLLGTFAARAGDALIVADRSISSLNDLLKGSTAPAVLIDRDTDALPRLSREIAQRHPRVLHLVAHGSPGRLQLGSTELNREFILAHAAELRSWGVQQIALWSCNVAQDDGLLTALAEATGAVVHASTGAVGAASAGGRWDLDRTIGGHGEIAGITQPFSDAAMAAWPEVLATIYFNKVYQSTSTTGYTISSNSITIGSAQAGASFNFASENPADVTFSGNNVAGRLSWVNGATTTTKNGVISRRKKAGSNNLAFYFVICNLTNGLIDQNSPTGTAFLLIDPADETDAAVTANQTVGTDSSPVLADLNAFLALQATLPVATFNVGGVTVGEGAGFAVFTLSLSNSATSTWSFTPSLTSGTATIGTDTGSTLDYATSADNATYTGYTVVSGALSLSTAVRYVRLRVSIAEDALAESTETFVISTGSITGGGITNNGGTSATASIIDNDGLSTPIITVTPGTYTYSGSPLGPVVSDVDTGGSTGAVTLSYVGTGGTTYGPSATKPTTAGSYTVTASVAADSSYTAASSIATAFTIGKVALTVTADAKSKPYDGSGFSAFTATITGYVNSETISVVSGSTTYTGAATTATAAGTHTITPVVSGLSATNYTFSTANGTLTINSQASTVSVNPGTYTYSGAAQGPVAGDVNTGGSTGAVTLSYVGTGGTTYGPSATKPTTAGSYTVTASVAADSSYTAASSIPTAFTISKVALTVTADAKSKPYDGSGFSAFTATITGYVNSETISVVSGSTTYTGAATTATAAGTHTITPVVSGLSATNYTFSTANGTLTINSQTPPQGGKLPGTGTADPNYSVTNGRYEITTPEDTPVSGQVKAYDAEGDPLTFTTGTGPSNGTVRVNHDGTYTYTPNKDFNGTDSFTVIVSDGKAGTSVITVVVNVGPANDLPVPGKNADGTPDPAFIQITGRYETSTNQDAPVSSRIKAYDVDGDRLTYSAKTAPSNGKVVVNPDGTYTYTPNAGYSGTDSFVVTVDDGRGGNVDVTVYVLIYAAPVNRVPKGPFNIAADPVRVVGADGSTFGVSDADSPELTVTLTSGHGVLTLPTRTGLTLVSGTGANDLSVTVRGPVAALNAALAQLIYQTQTGFFGTDTVTITSVDEHSNTDVDRIDPPFTVEFITLGGNTVNGAVSSLADPSKAVVSAKVTSFDASIISGALITGTGASSRLAVGTPTRQDGSVQQTTVKVTLTYADGTSDTRDVKVTIYNPKLNLVTALALNPQTSLYEQKVQVTNTTPYTIDSFRVIIPMLPGGVSLYSRTTTTSDGRTAIDDSRAMAPGEVRVFVIEYFAPNVAKFAEPALTLQINSAGALAAPIGTNAPVDRVVVGANNRTYVEFSTASDRTYWVQYRDSATGVWQTSLIAVNGTGTTIHWLDEGWPMTLSAPTAAREYRVLFTNGVASALTVSAQPASSVAAAGAAAGLEVAVSGASNLTYQWYRDGVAVAGATNATYSIAKAGLNDEGNYYVVTSDGRTAIQSQVVSFKLQSSNPGRIVNLSVRAKLDPGTTPLITGFVIQGEGSRPVLLRGIGETLQSFGLPGAAKDVATQLYRASTVIAENDDWSLDPAAATTRAAGVTVGAFPLAAASKDAAMVRRLLAESYTLHTVSRDVFAGVALVEVYDALGSNDGSNRFANVSARAKISAGDGVLIAGIVISGETTCRVLVRAVGPTLAGFGVTGVLADPTLALYLAGSSAPVATNDDWSTVQSMVTSEGLFKRVGAFDLPTGSKDSVLITRVPPGAYTLVASGKGTAEGQTLIEIYLID